MVDLKNINVSYIPEYESDIDTVCTEITMAYRDYFYLFYIGEMIKDKKCLLGEMHNFLRHIVDLLKEDLILHIYKLSDNSGDCISIHKLKNNLAKNWVGDELYIKSFYTIPNLDTITKPFRIIRHEKVSHCKSSHLRTKINETLDNAKFILEEYRKCYNSILLNTNIKLQDLSDIGLESLRTNCEIGCQLLSKDMLITVK